MSYQEKLEALLEEWGAKEAWGAYDKESRELIEAEEELTLAKAAVFQGTVAYMMAGKTTCNEYDINIFIERFESGSERYALLRGPKADILEAATRNELKIKHAIIDKKREISNAKWALIEHIPLKYLDPKDGKEAGVLAVARALCDD